jgi:hypothetical protein
MGRLPANVLKSSSESCINSVSTLSLPGKFLVIDYVGEVASWVTPNNDPQIAGSPHLTFTRWDSTGEWASVRLVCGYGSGSTPRHFTPQSLKTGQRNRREWPVILEFREHGKVWGAGKLTGFHPSVNPPPTCCFSVIAPHFCMLSLSCAIVQRT